MIDSLGFSEYGLVLDAPRIGIMPGFGLFFANGSKKGAENLQAVKKVLASLTPLLTNRASPRLKSHKKEREQKAP